MRKQLCFVAATLASMFLWADAVESLTTTDENVSVYPAKDASGDMVMHFTNTTSTMSFTVNRSCFVRLLAVGGGGAGNAKRGGGGGAGGLILNDAYQLEPGTYTVSVGAGGTRVTNVNGQGNSTSAAQLGKPTILKRGDETILTACGGGFGGYTGGSSSGTTGTTVAGGSGGGVGAGCTGMSVEVSSVDGSLVNCGGLANPSASVLSTWNEKTGRSESVGSGDNAAGGGGGAGSAGHCGYNANDGSFDKADLTGRKFGSRKHGDGGDGIASDITGESRYYAGGGGGSGYFAQNGGTRGLGGSGVGGNGGGFVYREDLDAEFAPASDGLDGTGSGGGGAPQVGTKTWYRLNGNKVTGTSNTAMVEYEGSTSTVVARYSAADSFCSGAGGSGALILRWASTNVPQMVPVSAEDNGDATGTVTFDVVNFGEEGVSSAEITIHWGLVNQLWDGEATAVATSTGETGLTLTNLIPGHTYYYSATIVNSASVVGNTVKGSFTVSSTSAWPAVYPEGLPVIGSVAVSQIGTKNYDLRVAGKMKQVVAGMTATFCYSFDANASVDEMESVPVTDLGLNASDEYDYVISDLLSEDRELYCYLKVSSTVEGVTRTDVSAKMSVAWVGAAKLGEVNKGVAALGAGYDTANIRVNVAIAFTPGFGENLAEIYLIKGDKPHSTGFDKSTAVLVKSVDCASCYSNGVLRVTVAKWECPEEILWNTAYYYWVVVKCGDADTTYETAAVKNTSSTGATENVFKYEDARRPGSTVPGSTIEPVVYYVSTTGSDEADGTRAHPWRTLTYAAKAEPVKEGDEIRVQAGVYEEAVKLLLADGAKSFLRFVGGWDENWVHAPTTAKTVVTPPAEGYRAIPCIEMTTHRNVFQYLTLTGGSAGISCKTAAQSSDLNTSMYAHHDVQSVVFSNNVTAVDLTNKAKSTTPSFEGVAMVSCLVVDNETGFDHSKEHCAQSFFYNCTFARNSGVAVKFNTTRLGHSTFRNCVFEGNGTHFYTMTYSYLRIFANTCLGTSTGRGFTRREESSCYDLPNERFLGGVFEVPAKLDADFRPTSDSPFNGRGADLSADSVAPCSTDLEGVPFGSSWTYGCYSSELPAHPRYADVYVSGTGDDENSGLSAEDPLRTLGAAVVKVETNGTIHAAAGTYSPVVLNVAGLTLEGAGRDVTFICDSTTDNPKVSGRAALEVSASDITVRGVTATNAFAGAVCESTGHYVDHVWFYDCDFVGCVHGVCSRIEDNLDRRKQNLYHSFERCRMTDNLGCGAYIENTSRMSCCLLARNGKGLYFSSGNMQNPVMCVNLTVVDNRLYGIEQKGAAWVADTYIYNSIIANNATAGVYRVNDNYSGGVYLNNCHSGNEVNYDKVNDASLAKGSRGGVYVTDCSEGDAKLRGAGAHQYELASDSPCLGKGVGWNDLKPEKDLNGNPIAYAAGFALGCYQPTHPGFLVIIR